MKAYTYYCVFTLLILVFAMVGALVPQSPVAAALTDVPTAWSNFSFYPVTYNGGIISDYESSSDPSRGAAAVNPTNTDISSCSPNGYLPGNQPSFQYAYYDGGTPALITDDYLSLRMRLNGTTLENSQVGLDSGHWFILIDVDEDGWKEYAIDIDGTVGSNRPDRVYLLYNDLPTNSVTPRSSAQRSNSDTLGGDEINLWYAAGPAATGIAQANNHVRELTATPTCYGGGEYWLDVQLPMSAFNTVGRKILAPGTPARFLISTSASAVDPMQKDWMLKVQTDPIFSDPWGPSVNASKTDVLLLDNDGNGTASPGDVLRYDITITNSGLLAMLNVVFSDNITDPNLLLIDHSVVTTGTIVKDTGNEVTVTFASIPAGASATISFRVTILFPQTPGVSVVSNQGLVSGSNFTTIHTDDPDTSTPGDATRTMLTVPPTLRITKDGPSEANVGSIITFTGTLTNYGTIAAENVTLVDQLPSWMTFVSSSQAAVYDPVANTVTWYLGSLNGGASITGWLAVQVNNTTPDGTTMTNTFSVTWQDGAGTGYGPYIKTRDVIARASPLLSIVKNGPATGTRGGLLTYTGTLTNYGSVAAENVTLVDYLPARVTFVSSSHGAVYNAGANTVTWSLGTLNAGAVMTGWLTVQVDNDVPNGTTLTDRFSVTWEDIAHVTYGSASSTADTVIYTAPQITITKEGPEQATVGSYITFTGILTNVGGSPAENVTLVDYLPPGLTFVGSSHTAVYDDVTRTVTWYLGTVSPGTSIPGWVEVRVGSSLPDGTDLLNTFSVTWKDGSGAGYGPSADTADVIARTSPLLTVTKSGPAEAGAGDTLTFTLNVTNFGGLSAYNVTLVDVLADNYTYVSSSPAGTASGGNVIWGLGTVASGSTSTVSLTVRVNDGVANATTLLNGAMVSWQDSLGNGYGPAGSGLATTIFTVPHLAIAKTGPATANPGNDCTYTITLTNTSSTAADNTTLVDYLPAHMSYVTSVPAGTPSVPGDNVTWYLGTIEGGASRSISITLRVDPSLVNELSLRNMAVTTWKDDLDNNYGPAGSTARTDVTLFPLLSIAITGPSTGQPCDTVTYTLRVTNTSTNLAADNVIAQYIMPAGLIYMSSSDGGSYTDGMVIWNLGTLAPGGSRTVTVTLNYCVIPAGSDIISTAATAWQYPGGTMHGPVFDTTKTHITEESPPPPPPPPSPPPLPQPQTSPVPQPQVTSHSSTMVGVGDRPWLPTPSSTPATAIINKPVDLPAFKSSNLVIQSTENGHIIYVDVTNTGKATGTYTLNLKLNGYVEQSTALTLNPSASTRVQWMIDDQAPGTYNFEIDGLAGSYTVDILQTANRLINPDVLLLISTLLILSSLLLALIYAWRKRRRYI